MEKRTVSREKRMPTFIIEMWNKDNYDAIPNQEKHLLKRMWAGSIEHVQTKERKFFRQASELLKFIEDRRT